VEAAPPTVEAAVAGPEPGEAATAAEEVADDSFAADQAAPEEQGPGDSEGGAPASPDDA